MNDRDLQPGVRAESDIESLPELDARARHATTALHAAIGKRPAAAHALVPSPRLARQRARVALLVAVVLLAAGAWVAFRPSHDHVATTSNPQSIAPLAPTALPAGFSVFDAAASNKPPLAVPQIAYAHDDGIGALNHPILYVGGTTAHSLTDDGACIRHAPGSTRSIGVLTCDGSTTDGGVARVQDGTVILEIDGLWVTTSDLIKAANGLHLVHGRPKIDASALPADTHELGEVGATLVSSLPSERPLPARDGYTEFFTAAGQRPVRGSIKGVELNAAPETPAGLSSALIGAGVGTCTTVRSCTISADKPEAVAVGNHRGWLIHDRATQVFHDLIGGETHTVVWEQDGQLLQLDGYGITEAQTLAAAASVRPLSQREWASFLAIHDRRSQASASTSLPAPASTATTNPSFAQSGSTLPLGPVSN